MVDGEIDVFVCEFIGDECGGFGVVVLDGDV